MCLFSADLQYLAKTFWNCIPTLIRMQVGEHEFSVQIWIFHLILSKKYFEELYLHPHPMGQVITFVQICTFNLIPSLKILGGMDTPRSGGLQTWLFCADLHLSCTSYQINFSGTWPNPICVGIVAWLFCADLDIACNSKLKKLFPNSQPPSSPYPHGTGVGKHDLSVWIWMFHAKVFFFRTGPLSSPLPTLRWRFGNMIVLYRFGHFMHFLWENIFLNCQPPSWGWRMKIMIFLSTPAHFT